MFGGGGVADELGQEEDELTEGAQLLPGEGGQEGAEAECGQAEDARVQS